MEDSNNKRFNKRHYYTMKEKLEVVNYYHFLNFLCSLTPFAVLVEIFWQGGRVRIRKIRYFKF